MNVPGGRFIRALQKLKGGRFIWSQFFLGVDGLLGRSVRKKNADKEDWHTLSKAPPQRTIELDDAKKIKSLRDLIFLAQFNFWDAKWQVKASAYEKKVVKNKVCLKR